MKLSTIAGSLLVCSFLVVSTAEAQTNHSAAGMCRGRTAAQSACFDGNNEGWLWFNWTSSGTCNASTMPLVCGLEEPACTNMTRPKQFTIDGNCSSSMNCYLRVVNYVDGTRLPAYPITIPGGPGNFHSSVSVPCSDIGDRNYVTVQCDVPVGCKIWGVTTRQL